MVFDVDYGVYIFVEKPFLTPLLSSLKVGLTCLRVSTGRRRDLVTGGCVSFFGKEGRRASGAPTDRKSEQRPACAYSLASSYRHGRILPDLTRTG